MNKNILFLIVAILVLLGGFFVMQNLENSPKIADSVTDYKNAEYIIDNNRIKLLQGISEIEVVPGSASKIITRYFGNEVRTDLNLDGREDVVFLMTQNAGGSGTFYYVVAALNTIDGYVGSHGLLLGDRIAPQTTEMSKEVGKEHIVVVNYADRKPGESFAVSPSIGKSIWLKFDPVTMQFGEVVQNFEGEADPKVMSLSMKPWVWIRAVYGDGKTIAPQKAQAFVLTFNPNGTFSAKTDCNGVSGSYTTGNDTISFGSMVSTLMYCEGSQESEFTKLLSESDRYHFTSKGEFIINLKQNSTTMTFK